MARADRANLADRGDLLKLMERYPRTRGIGKLRTVLDLDGGPALTRSEAESRLLHLIRRAKLPRPETNVRIAGLEVDFLWPAERLVLEMDGFEDHASRAAFEWDRERDSLIATAGMRFLRVTWRQLLEEPEAVVARVARSLGARAQAPARQPGNRRSIPQAARPQQGLGHRATRSASKSEHAVGSDGGPEYVDRSPRRRDPRRTR